MADETKVGEQLRADGIWKWRRKCRLRNSDCGMRNSDCGLREARLSSSRL